MTNTNAESGFFSNNALHIGQFSNASLRFNGYLYSLIVRGALSDSTEIDEAEAWVNSKTEAY
jgi:hypothetical protein